MNINELQKRLNGGEILTFDKPAIVMLTGSAGRRQIVRDAGLDWILLKSNFDEDAVKTDKLSVNTLLKARDYCRALAKAKLKAVKGYFENAAVITADTVVFSEKLLEKPRTEAEVYEMIRGLLDKPHSVITAVSISDGRNVKNGQAKEITFDSVSEVLLSGVTDEAIARMIEIENPYACSGGYTIDGMLGKYFKVLSGNVDNVIGLPLDEILKIIR